MFGLSQIQLIASIVLLAALSASAVYIVILRTQATTLKSEKETLQTKLDMSQANLFQLKNDIDAQNVAIQKLKTDTDERVAKGLEEIARAKASAASSKARADSILSRKPPVGANICDAANDLFNQEIKHGKK